MDLKALKDTPPWDWPAGTVEKLLNVLGDEQAIESDRLLATDMAGDCAIVNDELVATLLAILGNSEESKQVRARAAISLGPILEEADTEGLDDAGDVPISKWTFQGIQESLHQLYRDAHIPKEVRRRILEASVRAPGSGTRMPSVPLTRVAMTCGNFPRSSACASSAGSMSRLLKSSTTKIQTFTLRLPLPAGSWGVEAAWPHIAALIHSPRTPKPLLLAAIGAVPSVRAQEASEVLSCLIESDDEHIVEAVHEALAKAEEPSDGGRA
jgi:uncharacterized protein (UPF0147 family)